MKIPAPADTLAPPYTCRCSLVLSLWSLKMWICLPPRMDPVFPAQKAAKLRGGALVYILLLLSILAKSHLPAKISAVEVNKTHCGLVLPLGSQSHTPPSVLLPTVAL